MKKINLSVVAHVDHGKSTLCDAIIEYCEKVIISQKSPTLDSHTIEQKRGVTIRNHFISLKYKDLIINLIDTPGHYDFAQYVTVGINSADIVLVVIDVIKGIQPQTLSYMNVCIEKKVNLVIVLNKIDIYFAEINRVKEIIKNYFGEQQKIIEVSAFKRINIDILIDYIYENTQQNSNFIYRSKNGLYILDCVYGNSGTTKVLVQSNKYPLKLHEYIVIKDKKYRINRLYTKKFQGDINLADSIQDNIFYIDMSIDVAILNNLIGCLIDDKRNIIPMCSDKMHTSYIGLISNEKDDLKLKKALDKICLGDPGVVVYKRFSKLYGNVFVCGFLGDFHREIFLERLETESDAKFSSCYIGPSYKTKNSSEYLVLDYRDKLLYINFRKYLNNILTPFITLNISFPQEYYSKVYAMLSKETYNSITETKFVIDHFILSIQIPFTLLLLGFFNKLKSLTNGYSEFIVTEIIYLEKQLSLIEFFLNNELIEELSMIELKELSESVALFHLEQLKSKLERQQFLIKLCVKIDKKNFRSCVIKPYRKDVTAKLYGGDSTRRKKLLNKQKEGKDKMFKNANLSSVKKSIISVILNSSIH